MLRELAKLKGDPAHNYKRFKTKHPEFLLSSADTSIKVTVLPLTSAVYPWFEHCECTLCSLSGYDTVRSKSAAWTVLC